MATACTDQPVFVEPPVPPNEAQRLAALRALAVLDTTPEERFDRITRLAQRICGVPIAAVSLVDETRQWFKSTQGLGDVTETPRSVSFCGHAVARGSLFEVDDATTDPRFAGNPLVLGDPNIRFYAGFPIAAADGSLVGTLCVIDTEPRSLCAEDRQMLGDLAAMVEAELANFDRSLIDDMTGLHNRRGFSVLSPYVAAVAQGSNAPLALVFADVDGLKKINDTYGHDAGDVAIRTVGRLLAETLRGSDLVARLGGDEFVAALVLDEDDGADTVITRLEEALAAHNAALPPAQALSVSFGVVVRQPGDTRSVADLLTEADQEMYAMKVKGRS